MTNEVNVVSNTRIDTPEAGSSNTVLADFFAFRRMITPVLIQVMFWIGVIVCVVIGIGLLISAGREAGLLVLLLAPLYVRIVCEIMILFFRMNETLTEIKNKLK